MSTNKLTAKFCETAAVGSHFDGEGLYLLVQKDGKRYWRMACYHMGRKKLLSFGAFPKVSLSKARQARKSAQELLAQGVDPVQHKRALRDAAKQKVADEVRMAGNSFEQVARRLFESKRGKVTDDYVSMILRQMELHVFPSLGSCDIREIKGRDLLKVLVEVENKKNHGRPMTYLATKLCEVASEIFDYAMVEDQSFNNNPCRGVVKHLPKHVTKNMRRIDFTQLPEFIQS